MRRDGALGKRSPDLTPAHLRSNVTRRLIANDNAPAFDELHRAIDGPEKPPILDALVAIDI